MLLHAGDTHLFYNYLSTYINMLIIKVKRLGCSCVFTSEDNLPVIISHELLAFTCSHIFLRIFCTNDNSI